MTKDLSHKLFTGISPKQFMEQMTKNEEAFQDWYNRFSWKDEDTETFFESLNHRDDLRCFILAADWCGDVVRNVPVIFKAVEKAGIPTEVLVMEEHLDTMDQFLTMGGRAIPVVIITDTGGYVLGKWGPRPAHVQEVMTAFKQENPDRDAADYQDKIQVARAEMMKRYGDDTGYQHVIIQELRELLSGF
ncbi:thioredoxin family protein [Marinicrinis sediminis]|uniref:Thioredoxin family protein n=1 Tax=Marinicrinis sediminis TaxID=1652465 RepID=A0ABW5RES4_9BACL